MKTYFFGVIDARKKGHFLYDSNEQQVWDKQRVNQIPFNYVILDGGLLVQPEEQCRLHLAQINGWTVLGMWDRTADKRGACNASFIAEGLFTIEEMEEIAKSTFPNQWNRIQNR